MLKAVCPIGGMYLQRHTSIQCVLESPLTCGEHLYLTLYEWVVQRAAFQNNLVQKTLVVKSVCFELQDLEFVLTQESKTCIQDILSRLFSRLAITLTEKKGAGSCCQIPSCSQVSEYMDAPGGGQYKLACQCCKMAAISMMSTAGENIAKIAAITHLNSLVHVIPM